MKTRASFFRQGASSGALFLSIAACSGSTESSGPAAEAASGGGGGASTTATGGSAGSETTTGTGGAGGAANSVGGTGGTAEGGTRAQGGGGAGTSADSGPPVEASVAGDAAPNANHGNKILIYTKTTGFRHDSIPVAADAIAKAATAAGLSPEQSADSSHFATGQLAQYAVVVLLATTGEPFGSPGTEQIQNLVDFVRGGGGLVGIENANHAYDSSESYVSLLGGDFVGHPAYGPDTCVTVGNHQSIVRFPATFAVTDEIYIFKQLNPLNQVVLRCGSDKRPISWVRDEGAGRVFYTALGHDNASWTTFPLVENHVLPGLLWTMGRPLPP